MRPSTTTHPSAEQLKAYALGKLPAGELEALAQHLEGCSQCLELAAARHADSFVGKLRAAHPRGVTAGWAPQDLVPERGPERQELADLPPELRDSTKYRVLRELGRGGMGVIYLAEHQMMGKRVALKVISQALLAHPDAETRFRTEVRAAARLDHPNIVKALDADRLGDMHLLVMDYVDGLSLAEVLQRKGPFPVLQACNYIRQAALGLQHAFEQGMVHRDIKPQNLMLTRDGKVKILDFGLARLAREKAGKPGVTRVGDFMGTPEYVAPEQAMDASTADIRADLYSLGCTLYFLLAGRPPFQEGTAVQTILAQLEKKVTPLSTVRADVPETLWAVVARLLAKDPAQRFERPVDLAQALTPFCKPSPQQPAVTPTLSPVSSPEVDTQVAGDTSRLPERRAAAPPVVSAAAPFATADEPGPSVTPIRRNLAIGTGIGVAVLLLAVGGWLLRGVILRVPTKDGILVVDVEEPNPDVYVDGQIVTVLWAKGGKKAEIGIKPGTHKVEVKKDGLTLRGDDVEVKDGESVVFRARLDRAAESRKIEIKEMPPAPTETASIKPAPPAETVTEAQLRHRIETAWPGLGNRLSRDKAGNYTLYLRQCPQVIDLTPLKGMPLTTLNVTYNGELHDLTPLQGMKLKSLWLGRCGKLKDLRPLQGMDLDFLDLAQCNGLDLTHLKGMKIKLLSIWNRGTNEHLRSLQSVQLNGLIASGSTIDDLTPLQGQAITELVINDCGRLSDLQPLKGLPLTKLNIKGCDRIRDVTPLKDLPLKEIVCDFKPERDAKILRAIRTLEKINDTPVAEFWKKTGNQS